MNFMTEGKQKKNKVSLSDTFKKKPKNEDNLNDSNASSSSNIRDTDVPIQNERVVLEHCNHLLVKICNWILFISIPLVLISLLIQNLWIISKIQILSIVYSLLKLIPLRVAILLFYISIFGILFYIFMHLTILRKSKFDRWVVDIASKNLSTEYIWYKKNVLFINFDRNLNRKNIMDFVKIISDKSTKYTYYCENIDINTALVTLKVVKKEQLPTKTSIDTKTDTAWNIIPLGDVVNHKLQKISPIGWWLNDNNKRNDMLETLPSTSLLIAGGTGSGKSVTQNCIIGHISRFPDNFQLILGDVKMVEYGQLKNVQSVKKVALTIEEIAESTTQMRQIMMDRFSFMKDNGVNNVYKLVDNINVDYYEINGKKYQFDEIFSVYIDGELKLMTIDKIYEEVEAGKVVEIDESYGVM